MAAPVVQTLDEIIASLQPGYAQQEELYNQQINALPGQAQARKQGLEVAKTNTFRDINSGANSKGLAFSGMPIEEQTRYTGEKYLPGLQAIDNEVSENQMRLKMALAQLGTEKRSTALSTRQQQEATAREWQQRQEERAWQERQAAIERSAARETPKLSAGELRQGAIAFLDAGRGRDKKVSPERYLQAKKLWIDEGGSPEEFDQSFKSYINEKHAWDYGFGTKPGKKNNNSKPRYGRLANNPTF